MGGNGKYNITVGLVLWQSLFPSYYPINGGTSANEQYDQEESAKQDPEIGISKVAIDKKIADYTLALAVFTAMLALVAAFQIGFLIRAEHIAATSAKAAEKSANVARDTLIA